MEIAELTLGYCNYIIFNASLSDFFGEARF